jgi:threonine synthase
MPRTSPTTTFVTHLESALDGTRLDAGRLQTTHEGRPLLVRYDLEAVREAVTPAALAQRPPTMWRYRELLPIAPPEAITLGETITPLLECPRLAGQLGMERLLIKDESRLPTGSFKSRGMAVAVSMAVRLGARMLAVPSAGNAGGALAAYAARGGVPAFVFMPADTPAVNRYEAAAAGARVWLVDGLISDCAAIVREGVDRVGWFDLSTLKEPYRLEGKKTMGLELAEQLGWRLPDVILYPTGGGTGLVGMHKAFDELARLGWVEPGPGPRMYCCQSTGCDPMVRAWAAGDRFAEPVRDARTRAAGIRVPGAVGDFLILEAVRASGGRAMAAPEERMREWMDLAWGAEGIALCPEAAFCVGVLQAALAEGHIRPDEEVVLFNTGAGQKYPEILETHLPTLGARARPDWDEIAGA